MVARADADKSPFELTPQHQVPRPVPLWRIDTNPSPEDQATFDGELTRLGIPHQFYSYPEADHAFMDYNRPRYHKSPRDRLAQDPGVFATHLKAVAVS